MIEVTSLRLRDLAAVTALFEQATATLPYRWPLTPDSFRQEVLFSQTEPFATLAEDAEGWLVARAGEQTLGFAHCAIEQSENEKKRRGFLRFFTTLLSGPNEVAPALLAAIDSYFRERRIDPVHAFHIRTGYSCVLAGRGVFSGDRIDLMSALGDAGYRVSDRWFLYEKMFPVAITEHLPALPDICLQIDASADQGFTFYAAQRARPVGEMIVEFLPSLSTQSGIPTASLTNLIVQEKYRRKGTGQWLIQRGINELAAQGYQRLVVDVHHSNAPAQSMMLHLGFEELPVRGFSYSKRLSYD